MIPILASEHATDWSDGPGMSSLEETIKAEVTEELNGEFFLRLTYPANGALFRKIDINRVILAEPGDGRTRQPFQITEITRKINGTVEIYAPHISHQLNYFFVKPFFVPVDPATGKASAETLMSSLGALAITETSLWPFNFRFYGDSELGASAEFTLDTPKSIRSMLGKGEDSALNAFGGELEWDKWAVRLKKRRGRDSGILIDYGKDLTDLVATKNTDGMVEAVIPFWFRPEKKEPDGTVIPKRYERLTEYVLFADQQVRNPFAHTVTLDLSNEIDEDVLGVGESAERLIRSVAQNWLAKNENRIPFFSADVNFVPLWKTEEYNGLSNLQTLQLGDSVTIKHDGLLYRDKLRVVKTTYDVLRERYLNMEMGNLRETLTRKISGG